MESKPFCWILLSFLTLSCFVAQTHGKKQVQAYHVNESNVYPQEGLKEKDRIERLPGQPHVNFSQYGGYVTVNNSAGHALYYYFVEAQHSKDSLPLLLWLTGGIDNLFSVFLLNVTGTNSCTTSIYIYIYIFS